MKKFLLLAAAATVAASIFAVGNAVVRRSGDPSKNLAEIKDKGWSLEATEGTGTFTWFDMDSQEFGYKGYTATLTAPDGVNAATAAFKFPLGYEDAYVVEIPGFYDSEAYAPKRITFTPYPESELISFMGAQKTHELKVPADGEKHAYQVYFGRGGYVNGEQSYLIEAVCADNGTIAKLPEIANEAWSLQVPEGITVESMAWTDNWAGTGYTTKLTAPADAEKVALTIVCPEGYNEAYVFDYAAVQGGAGGDDDEFGRYIRKRVISADASTIIAEGFVKTNTIEVPATNEQLCYDVVFGKDGTINADQIFTVTATVAKAEPVDNNVYVIGDINGAGWKEDITDYPIEDADGMYMGIFTFTGANNYIKIKQGNKIYGCTDADTNVASGMEYPLVEGGDKTFVLPAGKHTFFIYKDDEGALVSLTVMSEITYPETMYILGNLPDAQWDPAKGFEMTRTDNGIFEASGVELTDASEGYGFFSFCVTPTGDWSTLVRYGSEADGTLATLNGSTPVVSGSNSFKLPAGKKYDILLNLGNGIIWVEETATAGDEIPDLTAPLAVTASGTDPDLSWSENTLTATLNAGTEANGTLTFAIPEGYNKMYYMARGVVEDIPGTGDVEPLQNRVPVNDIEWLDLTSAAGFGLVLTEGNVLTIPADGKTYEFSVYFFYAPENGINFTDTFSVLATVNGDLNGVNGIEATEGDAMYFNLQGQRVANPEPGIYVRVLNGKTQKVVVK